MTKLADDETYNKRYENLTPSEKQEIDAQKRKRLKEAQAEVDKGDSFSQRASDVTGRVLRGAAELVGSTRAKTEQQNANAEIDKREADRQRRLQEAKDSANWAERDRALYNSKTPGKLKDNPLPLKKGGKVSSASRRADGIAQKGRTKGRMV